MKDYIIVGFGFAGISFTHLLEKNNKNFVVINDNPNPVTTTAAALFNPVILKRFTPVWKAEEQMELLNIFYTEIQEKLNIPILKKLAVFRKFTSLEEQNNWFSASDKPSLTPFLSTKIEKEINPYIETPFGLGEVMKTGRVDTKELVTHYIQKLKKEEKIIEEKLDYSALEINENYVKYKDISAKKIVFCEGYKVVDNPFFNYLPMQGSKGELLTFRAELNLDKVVKSDGFIIPFGENIYKIGATYNNTDKTSTITKEAREELTNKLKKLTSCPFEIIHQEAGIRPTIIDRRPLVGKHPEKDNIFILNGLGTRGAMLAPYTATALYDFIEKNIPIDKEMNISRFEKKFYTT
ncbi:MAG: FAD-dependent oxidoreductase [Capnocytophaga sp.]|nr:FAD-dependent oxidoreductase [Capnocytophaga sp.]